MIKYYFLDVVIHKPGVLEPRSVSGKYGTRQEAVEAKLRILSEMEQDEYSTWKKAYPVVQCSCGEEVDCLEFTNTCERCRKDYNFNGALLAPRHQWGEETGEHWSEIP